MTDIEPIKQQIAGLGNDALRDLYANLTGAKAFVLEQAPDVCRQIIAWQIAQGIIAVAILLIVAPITVWVWRQFQKAMSDDRRYRNNEELPWLIAGIALSVVSLIALCASIGEGAPAIKAIVAPKLFLLEYIAHMLKCAS